MKPFKSERSQAVIPVVLIAILVFVVVYFGLLANQRNIAEGADTFGEAAADAIENYTYDQEIESMVWQIEHGAVMEFWLSKQKLYPNKYAANKRPLESQAATNCYNNNGFFQLWEVLGDDGVSWDLHGLCQDNDKKIYDIILRRRGTSNEYDFINAFMPKQERGNLLSDIIHWLKGKPGAKTINPPTDITIYIDGVIAP